MSQITRTMQFFKYFLVSAVVLALVIPADAGWFRKAVRKIGRGIRKTVKAVVKPLKKIGCKVFFGIGCPLAVGAAGTALAVGTSGTGAAVIGIGVQLGKHACRVRSRRCKRSVDTMEIMLPFSDEFMDYDRNNDKYITYEEFVFAVMTSVHLVDQEELMEPFMFADADNDGRLGMDEFQGGPFLFSHAYHNTNGTVSAAA